MDGDFDGSIKCSRMKNNTRGLESIGRRDALGLLIFSFAANTLLVCPTEKCPYSGFETVI